MAKPVFRGSRKKWHLGFKMDKMVTRGRLSIHLQKASQLSKEWGEGQFRFTDEELDFIINYDIKYRMGQEEPDENWK